ncbi:MAG: galactose oxidase [Gemmatimonadetes bacterium]|nr:galactose oxidase [Gemmatimonadota bacterium]
MKRAECRGKSLVTLGVVACTSVVVSSAGVWSTAARLPEPLQEISAATLHGRVYVIGGINTKNEATRTVYRYDPAGDRWERLHDFPDYRHHMPLAVLNDSLYTLGGYSPPGFTPVGMVLVYDETRDAWLGRAFLPEPRGASAAAAVAGRIVVVGGTGMDGKHLDSIAIYDPATDEWRHGAPIPTLRDHLTAGAVGDILYAIGGRRSQNFDVVEAYDLKNDRWAARAGMPSRRGGLGSAVLGGQIYTVGGENPDVFENHERYDPAADRWTTLSPLPTPRHGLGVTTIGQKIYVIGGGPKAGFAQTDVVEVFTP